MIELEKKNIDDKAERIIGRKENTKWFDENCKRKVAGKETQEGNCRFFAIAEILTPES